MRFTITAADAAAADIGLRCWARHTDQRTGSFAITCTAPEGEFHVEFRVTGAGVSIKVQEAAHV